MNDRLSVAARILSGLVTHPKIWMANDEQANGEKVRTTDIFARDALMLADALIDNASTLQERERMKHPKQICDCNVSPCEHSKAQSSTLKCCTCDAPVYECTKCLKKPQRWEYMILGITENVFDTEEIDALNKVGREGWEMFQSRIDDRNIEFFYFKRPCQQ